MHSTSFHSSLVQVMQSKQTAHRLHNRFHHASSYGSLLMFAAPPTLNLHLVARLSPRSSLKNSSRLRVFLCIQTDDSTPSQHFAKHESGLGSTSGSSMAKDLVF